MSPELNLSYWIQKKAGRKTGYPLATVAYYGPDDTWASKVVVGIFLNACFGPIETVGPGSCQ